MFAHCSNLRVGELIHVIADAHIYDRHIPIVEKLIKANTYAPPQIHIDESIDDFYNFSVDSFSLVGYNYNHEKYEIPVAIFKEG